MLRRRANSSIAWPDMSSNTPALSSLPVHLLVEEALAGSSSVAVAVDTADLAEADRSMVAAAVVRHRNNPALRLVAGRT